MVDKPKEAVDQHFAAIMEELLTECGSRQWRARQSAAAGLGEVLTGRRFAEVGPDQTNTSSEFPMIPIPDFRAFCV